MININRIKETILYYVVCIWMDTWIYHNMVLPVVYIKKDIIRSVTRDDAEKLINRKCYKYISKTYKEKLLNENFK